ncbi:DUF1643 domain-containing protein [Lachnospiraceae bacterium LCP25S3_G4]
MKDLLFIKENDNTYQYAVGMPGKHNFVCLDLFPNEKTDKRWNKIAQLAKNKKYDGWILLYVYPQVQMAVDELDIIPNNDIISKNLETIIEIIKEYNVNLIYLIWGTGINKKDYFQRILQELCERVNKMNVSFGYLGKLTKEGHPKNLRGVNVDAPKKIMDLPRYLSWNVK